MQTKDIMRQLAVLTTVRDFELLELGLLKSLEEMFKLRSIKFLTISDANNRYEFRGYFTAPDGASQRCAEGGSLQPEPELFAPGLWRALEQTRTTGQRVTLFTQSAGITVYPLLVKDTLIGYVIIEEGRHLDTQDHQVIEGILRVFHNYYTLLEESQRDTLTGLLNRKTFDEKISRILSAIAGTAAQPAHEDGQPAEFWLAVMDIDHFKRINDTFGHIYGDEVLLLVSRLMRRSFRSDDWLFRFGGEEFVAIVSARNGASAMRAFQRFRRAVEQYRFPQLDQVTVSIGAVRVEHYVSPAELVGRADQALYYAKRHGRNQVAVFGDLVARGEIAPPATPQGTIELF